jgi:hypothetical protein
LRDLDALVQLDGRRYRGIGLEEVHEVLQEQFQYGLLYRERVAVGAAPQLSKNNPSALSGEAKLGSVPYLEYFRQRVVEASSDFPLLAQAPAQETDHLQREQFGWFKETKK